jgi:hypothetical protein
MCIYNKLTFRNHNDIIYFSARPHGNTWEKSGPRTIDTNIIATVPVTQDNYQDISKELVAWANHVSVL